jgi:hypothetical protein
LNYRYFYESSGLGPADTRGNRGSACVTVERVSAAKRPMSAPPAGSICGQATARSADHTRTSDGASEATPALATTR